ncbi:MAG: caspase family protein [Pyrinomonadaceae bacterium]
MKPSIKSRLIKSAFVASFLFACVLGSSSLAISKAPLDPVASTTPRGLPARGPRSAVGTDTRGRRDWEPKRTWVFIVGILKWKDSETFKPFPQLNRRDAQLAEFFRGAGVPANQLVFLRDEQATIRRVRTEFSEMLSQTREGDFLFVYFTGHGYKSEDERETLFATYDASERVSGWSTRSIVRDINWGFHGSRVFLTADCCYSGALAQDARSLNSEISYACVTSATADEASTENWTFTEMLLASLRGTSYADLNGDRKISLGELVENERRDMKFAEEQESSFASRGFPTDMVLAPATESSNPAIGRRVVVRSEGEMYKGRIIGARGSRYLVRYFGYDDSYDEWVSQRQIRGHTRRDETGVAEKWLLGRESSSTSANSWGQ